MKLNTSPERSALFNPPNLLTKIHTTLFRDALSTRPALGELMQLPSLESLP